MFITFEGVDGSGKTTQIQLLQEALEADGYTVVRVREPGGTQLSETIRTLLLSSDVGINSVAETLLFNAARAQLITEVIKPALQEGHIVISDRFYDSTIAYQAFGRGLAESGVAEVNSFAVQNCHPDLTLFIDVPPEAARLRAEQRNQGNKDRMERNHNSFFDNVYAGFKQLAQQHPTRIHEIDGLGTKNEIHSSVLKIVKSVL